MSVKSSSRRHSGVIDRHERAKRVGFCRRDERRWREDKMDLINGDAVSPPVCGSTGSHMIGE
jgi:hypothetical protein